MAQALSPHQQLAGYEILGLVGKGGMGEVYRARQLSMDRVVALKVLHLHHAKQDPFTKSFVEEARAAGRLSHPNIVSVHDVGSTTIPGSAEQVYYFSMEFIEGESLKELIGREGRLPDALLPVVMNGMAEALTYAEKMGIVHRDIKPDNIMLTKDRLVKLADLGLAVQVGGEQVADERTPEERSKVMGTPMYMSPEQARAGKLDHRSDQYSLGATLFHLLTGQPPYRGTDARAIMRSHVFDAVPDPREVRPDVPEPWRQLCMRLMAKQPDERFATAADLRAAVHAAAHGISLASFSRRSPRLTPRRIGRGSRTSQLVGILAAVVVVVGGASIALFHHGAASDAGTIPITTPSGTTTGTGTGTAPPSGANDPLQQRRLELSHLPQDPNAALALLAQLRSRPEWSGSDAQALLQAAEASARADLAQGHEKEYQLEQVRINALIDRGSLAEAKQEYDHYCAAHPEARTDTFLVVAAGHLGTQLAARAEFLRQHVAHASSEAEIAQALTDPLLPLLTPADQQSIQQVVLAQRAALAASANAQRRRAQQAAWGALAAELTEASSHRDFAHLGDILERHRAACASDAGLQAAMQAMEDLPTLTAVGDAALIGYVGKLHPTVDALVAGKPLRIQLAKWSTSEVVYALVPSTPAERPEHVDFKRVPRIDLQVPQLGDLLAKALPEDPRAQGSVPQALAACAWCWQLPGAAAAAAALGQDPLGKGLLMLISAYDGGVAFNGRVERHEHHVRVSYDFTLRQPALAEDFLGQPLTLGAHGLQWISATPLPAVFGLTGEEARLPRLAWRGQLLPPLTVTAGIWLHPHMALAMVGLESGGRRVRICISHRRFTPPAGLTDRIGLVTTDEDGVHFHATQCNDVADLRRWPLDQPVTLELAMNGDGQISCRENGQPLGPSIAGALPPGPTSVILQTWQPDGQTEFELTSLTIEGELPP